MNIKDNCGIIALAKLQKALGVNQEEVYISGRTFMSLLEDMDLDLEAYWANKEQMMILDLPFVVYYDNHYQFIGSEKDVLGLPDKCVVFTDLARDGLRRVHDYELEEIHGAKGESSTQVIQPSPPSQPTVAQSMSDYVANYPALMDLQLKYAPVEAQLQVDLAKQYAGDYGLAMRDAQDALYPKTSEIQEKLAGRALEGMSEAPPDWMREQYLSDLRSNLGTNVGSPIGADYTSRGLLELNKSWNDYYNNLGLSLAGRQPLSQAATPSYTNQLSGFTPNAVMNFNSQNYGTYAAASRPLLGQTGGGQTGAQMAGSIMGGTGALAMGVGAIMA